MQAQSTEDSGGALNAADGDDGAASKGRVSVNETADKKPSSDCDRECCIAKTYPSDSLLDRENAYALFREFRILQHLNSANRLLKKEHDLDLVGG